MDNLFQHSDTVVISMSSLQHSWAGSIWNPFPITHLSLGQNKNLTTDFNSHEICLLQL